MTDWQACWGWKGLGWRPTRGRNGIWLIAGIDIIKADIQGLKWILDGMGRIDTLEPHCSDCCKKRYKLYSDQLWCLVKCVEDGGMSNSQKTCLEWSIGKFMDHWGSSFADQEAPIDLQLIQASLPLISPTSFYTSHIIKSSAQRAIDRLSHACEPPHQRRKLTPNGRSSRHWKRSAWFAKISRGRRWSILFPTWCS